MLEFIIPLMVYIGFAQAFYELCIKEKTIEVEEPSIKIEL
tara:strand:+ start:1208 stop:1327 length:120 start_codon:yes stop_codon:yes gene_type:complete